MHPPISSSSSAAVNLASVKIPSSQSDRSRRRGERDQPEHQQSGDPQPAALPVDPAGVADNQHAQKTQQNDRVDKPWEDPEVVGDEFLQDSHTDHRGGPAPEVVTLETFGREIPEA